MNSSSHHQQAVRFLPASEADVAVIGRLRQAVWDSTYRGIHTDDMIDRFDYPRHAKQDAQKIRDPRFHVYLIEQDKEKVGYLIYRHEAQTLLLHSLNLLPQAQHQGIGRLAMQHVRQYAREHSIDCFQLQCSPWNENAMAFYKAMGGTVTAEETGSEARYMDAVWFRFSV